MTKTYKAFTRKQAISLRLIGNYSEGKVSLFNNIVSYPFES